MDHEICLRLTNPKAHSGTAVQSEVNALTHSLTRQVTWLEERGTARVGAPTVNGTEIRLPCASLREGCEFVREVLLGFGYALDSSGASHIGVGVEVTPWQPQPATPHVPRSSIGQIIDSLPGLDEAELIDRVVAQLPRPSGRDTRRQRVVRAIRRLARPPCNTAATRCNTAAPARERQ